MPNTPLPPLPPTSEIETPTVLKALIQAHRHLAELKGVARTIPNEGILIATLALQEAQSSSEIENIITTQDKLYKSSLQQPTHDPVTKEVAHYAHALHFGYNQTKATQSLTLNTIIKLQEILAGNRAGFRRALGTVLRNERTGEVVFEPPAPHQIPSYMSDLEKFINTPQTLDPLVCMALIHHQFETIHPFHDGNGRAGRIINILYLILTKLLDTPILYLSRYINQTKEDYYKYLQHTRDNNDWEPWLIYMLETVSVTAQHTSELVESISQLLLAQKQVIRGKHKFYSQDLMNNLFSHPYTKVAFLEQAIGVSRATATRYLDALSSSKILSKHKLGKENYYVNDALVNLLFNSRKIR